MNEIYLFIALLVKHLIITPLFHLLMTLQKHRKSAKIKPICSLLEENILLLHNYLRSIKIAVMILEETYYPISLKSIKEKVAKKKHKYDNKTLSIFEENLSVKEITNEFGETLVRVDGDIPIDLLVEKGQRFLFISYDQSRYSHGLHKYPAKFFPELPRWLIQKYSKEGDIILDPFMGSATTNIECLLHNRHSVGVDVDPFAKFLAKVKTTPLNEKELHQTNQILLEKITQATILYIQEQMFV